MKVKIIKYILILIFIVSCVGCMNRKSQLVTATYDSIEGESISIRWGDGTLFLVEDEEIIREYLGIISNIDYELTDENEDHYGFVYAIIYNDTILNDRGILDRQYILKDLTVINMIELLFHDYLPSYNGGHLEFQSDLMPDSHYYMLVEVEKVKNNILYFRDHQETYSFETGQTKSSNVFKTGDIIQIETDGRLPEGNNIEIKAYSISKMEYH